MLEDEEPLFDCSEITSTRGDAMSMALMTAINADQAFHICELDTDQVNYDLIQSWIEHLSAKAFAEVQT